MTIPAEVSRALRVTIPALDQMEQPIAPGLKGLLSRHYFPEPVATRDPDDEARIRDLCAVMLEDQIEFDNRQYHRATCGHCFGKDATPFEVLAWTCPTRGATR